MAKEKKEFKGLYKKISDIAYRHQISRVFDDFLKMAVCAFAQGSMEDIYMKIAASYNAEELQLFGHALAEMVHEYDNGSDASGTWNDILGDVFMEVNSSSQASASGQFFTPIEICNLMAQMVCDKSAETVCDPACGSSRNLIAHSRLEPNNRLHTFYYGSDLDERCVNMSVLNFIMFGLRGVVIHMDTLRMEIYKGYRIYLPELGSRVQLLTAAECRQFITSAKTDKEQHPQIETIAVAPRPVLMPQQILQQLALF